MAHREEIIKLLDQLPQTELEEIQAYLQTKLESTKTNLTLLPLFEKILSEDGEVLAELAK